MPGPEETLYERNQRFNRLVAWLHDLRFRHVTASIAALAAQHSGVRLRILDVGCAHAKLFSTLNARFAIDYLGVEKDGNSVAAARARYGELSNFHIHHGSALEASHLLQGADVILALETLEHIPENQVVRLVEAIAAARPKLFLCSVPVEIGPAIWLKNVGSLLSGYMRHQEYSWRETFWAGLYRLDKLPPHSVYHKGFDWRWLAQTIRHNLKIVQLKKLPLGFLPAALAFSVFFVATPRHHAPKHHTQVPQ